MADGSDMGAKKSRPSCFEGVIVHESKKYKFELPGLHCSLSDLSEVAYELTQVPSSRQRLIYKGKSLADTQKSLSECGIRNGAKIMLIGKKSDPVEEKLIQSIGRIEKEVDVTLERVLKAEKDFSSLQQGYLTKDQSGETVHNLEKSLKFDDEKLMKCLENLDCMDIDMTCQEAKAKRRNLIKRIQKLQDDIDALESKLKEYRTEIGI